MKIFLVSGHYYPYIFGGTEKVVQLLAETLALRKHEVVVATLSPERQLSSARVNGVMVHYVPLTNIYFPGKAETRSLSRKLLWHTLDAYNPAMATALGRLLDDECPDVVNTHNVGGFSPAAWSAVGSRHIPLVNTAHGLNLLCPRYMVRGDKLCSSLCLGCKVQAWPKRFLSQHVDVLTGVSRYVVDSYLHNRIFPHAANMVIYNCCESVAPMPPLVEDGPLRLGFLGRLHPTKGAHILIESFLQLPKGSAELLIAGTGAHDYESKLAAMVSDRAEVRFLGFVEPDELFRRVDVVVVPSLVHDSAPLVVMESLVRGIPLIGSKRGGIPELLDNRTGWLFEPNEPESLTKALRGAIHERGELAAMRSFCIKRAQTFSLDSMIDAYLNSYSQAIANNANRCTQN